MDLFPVDEHARWVSGRDALTALLSEADAFHLKLEPDLYELPSPRVKDAAVLFQRSLYSAILAWSTEEHAGRALWIEALREPLQALDEEGWGLWAVFRLERSEAILWRVADLQLRPAPTRQRRNRLASLTLH